MSRFLFALLCALLLSGQAAAYSGPTGMALLQDIENLPRMYDGVKVYQASSHDRGGGNYDSGNFITRLGNDYVMLDTKGPGEITRLWLTNAGPNHRVRFYLDGEQTPRIDLTVTELFSGAIYPFVWPLVGNDSVSSGGYYCYVPIPYSTGCRIVTDCKDLYYNVQYRTYDSAPGLASYSPCCDPREAISAWSRIGKQPQAKRAEKTLTVKAGASADVFDARGSGRIMALRIDLSGLGKDERSLAIIRGLRLRAYWDGAASPAVDAPLGPFFCSWFPESTAKGLLVGCASPGEYYCYYPMPFASRARIAIANQSGADVSGITVSVDWRPSKSDATDIRTGALGRFHAVSRKEALWSGDLDYIFANLKGRGIALGVSVLMIGDPGAGQGFLEGDERIYYDGASKPQIHGTGTEDFFNGGYYYDRGLFTLPLHGYTARRYEMRDQEAQYRLFLADRIFFNNGFRAGIEHGGTNDHGGHYASVFYYYAVGGGKRKVESGKPVAQRPMAPVAMSGRVTLAGGEPVAGAIIKVGGTGESGLTCPDGSYEVRNLAAGTYGVTVESPAAVTRTIEDVKIGGQPTKLDITVESNSADLLVNGDFSHGFENGVAHGWTRFDTEDYRGEFREGEGPGQFIHMPEPRDGDMYAGLWQTVQVVPGQLYTFSAECRTSYTGDEENPWDNVMGKLCVNPVGRQQLRSKDIDFYLFPAEHGVWHKASQEFAAVGDQVVVYLAAWRKFPRGGSHADVEFRNVRFVGPKPKK